jgi:hypothetical protein
MEASITSQNLETKGTKSNYPAEIFYNGIGPKFRNNISEREFRDIINKNKKYIDTNIFQSKYYDYFKDAINNPLSCELDLLIEFAGAIKLK